MKPSQRHLAWLATCAVWLLMALGIVVFSATVDVPDAMDNPVSQQSLQSSQ